MRAAEAGCATEVVTLGRGHTRLRTEAGGKMVMMTMMMMVMMMMIMVMSCPCDNLPPYHPEHKQKLKINIYLTFAMRSLL